MAYVDVTSCWRLNSRLARIGVASAGMFVEIVIAALAVLIWAVIDSPGTESLLYNLIVAAGLSTVLFNANPLMRFDGYYILADAIEVPNLYAEGSLAVRRIAGRLITGERSAPSTVSGWRRPFVVAYGLAALAWRLTICVSLMIAAATMFSGAGLVLAVIGVGVWFWKPLQQLWTQGDRLRRQDRGRFVRAVAISATLVSLVAVWIWALPFPTSVQVPAVTVYSPKRWFAVAPRASSSRCR